MAKMKTSVSPNNPAVLTYSVEHIESMLSRFNTLANLPWISFALYCTARIGEVKYRGSYFSVYSCSCI
jgi:hypothetical protein